MKPQIKFNPILQVILFFAALSIFTGCKEKTEKSNDLPGNIISGDLYSNLSKETQGKIISLNKEMKDGKDPSFENVSCIFPEMKYPPTIVGVKEHMGKYLISWDGAVICPPVKISFRVGKDSIPFGVEEDNVDRSLLDGYLPVVTTRYKNDGLTYEETVFAYSKDFSTGNPQVAFIRMRVANPSGEKKDTKLSVCLTEVEGRKDIPFKGKLTMKGNRILDENGKVIFWSKQPGGTFEKDMLTYGLILKPGEEKGLYFGFPHLPVSGDNMFVLTDPSFDDGLEKVKIFWKDLVEQGMQVDVPEEIVRNAYKTWLINNFILAEEDKSRQYYEVHDAPFFYETVFGYAASMWLNTLTTRGYFEEAKKCVDMFIKLQRPNGGFSGKRLFVPHQNGSIIYSISQLYRTSGDDNWFRTVVPHVIEGCNMIIEDCSKNKKLADGKKPVTYGLLSEYRYCEDEVGNATIAREYLGNAWCWAGLNQASIALGELGGEYSKESIRLKQAADEYRSDIFASMKKAMIKENDLAFLPMVITDKIPFRSLQENNFSNYYNILAPRMLESEIFDIDDKKIYWVPKFLEQRDGLVLGLARWKGLGGIDPHFIAGYALTNLRLDEIDKYLLTFYGLISYGMARETYSTQECSFIITGTANYGNAGEKHWSSSRQPHLHSTSEMIRMLNMMLLKEERNEIRIAFGTPRKWLDDGKKVEVRKARTCFGSFDFSISSHVSQGFINTELTTSLRKSPSVIRLKLRHPEGKKIATVKINGKEWNDFKGEIINIHPSDGDKMSIVATY